MVSSACWFAGRENGKGKKEERKKGGVVGLGLGRGGGVVVVVEGSLVLNSPGKQ